MRTRLLIGMLTVSLVSIAAMFITMQLAAVQQVRQFMLQGNMTDQTELISQLAAYYQANNSWDGVESIFEPRSQGAGHNGGSMMGSNGMGMGMQTILLADVGGSIVYASRAVSESRLSASQQDSALPVSVQGQTAGWLVLEGGMRFSQAEQGQLIQRLNTSALIAAGIGGLAAIVLAILLATSLARPLQSLQTAARQMAGGDLGQRVKPGGAPEISAVGRAFNQMASALQNAEHSRRSMTADIAHELRTPLAVQLAHLEALEDGIYPLTVDNLRPVVEQNRLLNRLVGDLRTLALVDAGELTLERSTVDLSALAGGVLGRFNAAAAQHNIQLVADLPDDPLNANLDTVRVEQILNNLLSNALRHTPPGGKVTLSLRREAGQASLSVADSGPGIPADALAHIFERFYRADAGRDRQSGGSGLGLAIARKLAQAHGGDLHAANQPKGGALFTLTLPVKHGQE